MTGLGLFCCCILLCLLIPFGLPADAALPGSETHSFPQGQHWLFGTEEEKQGADGAALQPVPEVLSAHPHREAGAAFGLCSVSQTKCMEICGCTDHSRQTFGIKELNFFVTTVSFPTTKLFLIMKIILQNSLQTEAHSSWSHTFFFSVSNPLFCMFRLNSQA